MNRDICCRKMDRGGPSPFEIVMLGWQDGLTSGMARCRSCGSTYHFEMVAWDAEQEVRIYGFRDVSQASYDAIATLNANPVAPERAKERSDALTLRTRDALATSFERTLFVAAVDLTEVLLTARKIDFPTWKELLRV
jgi:hypothetical protein